MQEHGKTGFGLWLLRLASAAQLAALPKAVSSGSAVLADLLQPAWKHRQVNGYFFAFDKCRGREAC